MTAYSFDYVAGRVSAHFEHGESFDFLVIDLKLDGEVTRVTTYDPESQSEGATQDIPVNAAHLRFEFSSVFCPCRDLIRFLEAVTVGVQECAFSWEAEGPDGRMSWVRGRQGTGTLKIEWRWKREGLTYGRLLNQRQMVAELYGAFRRFVESPRYDPRRYERAVSLSRALAFLAPDYKEAQTARWLAGQSEQAVNRACAALLVIGSDQQRQAATLTAADLRRVVLEAEDEPSSLEPEDASPQATAWVDPSWAAMGRSERAEVVRALLRETRFGSWSGDDLLETRSRLIEDWLASTAVQETRL